MILFINKDGCMPVSEILENRAPLVSSPDNNKSNPKQASSSEPNSLNVQDTTDVQSNRESLVQNNQRIEINKAIETTNIASRAVDDISRLLDGIQGIAEQAQDPKVSNDRVKILEKEAEGLRQEIIKNASVETPNGSKPLSGDPIRVEVEKTLGKALEVILPDDAKKGFGLSEIKLSPREVIINTVTSIERARQGLEKLKDGIQKGTAKLKDTVTALEVAQQNREASKASLRDVEDALDAAHDTKQKIKHDPNAALDSLGDFKNTEFLLIR